MNNLKRLEQVMTQVAMRHGLTLKQISTKRRTKSYAAARQESMALARRHTSCSLREIAEAHQVGEGSIKHAVKQFRS